MNNCSHCNMPLRAISKLLICDGEEYHYHSDCWFADVRPKLKKLESLKVGLPEKPNPSLLERLQASYDYIPASSCINRRRGRRRQNAIDLYYSVR